MLECLLLIIGKCLSQKTAFDVVNLYIKTRLLGMKALVRHT